MKKIFLIVNFLLTTIVFSENTVGTIVAEDGIYEGFTLFSIHKSVFLIDNCGQIINQWQSDYLPGNSVYLLEDGSILRAGRLEDGSSTISFGGRGGIVEIFNWDGDLTWSFTYSSSEYRQHHDVYPMPNGNVLILAASIIDGEDAIQAGRDPSTIVNDQLYNERIIEVKKADLTSGDIVWEWNLIDHVVQDFDPTKDNYGVISENPRKLDINFLNDSSPSSNWLHVNSIQYNEELDQIVLSSRNMSEIWIIEHTESTEIASGSNGGNYGYGGDFLYRWGNEQAYDRGTNRQLYGQHTPYIIPSGFPNAGKIMLYNNGLGRTPQYSEVFIIDPPTTSAGEYILNVNSSFGPNNVDFKYPETVPTTDSDFYSPIISSAQQLPNGNILVCEGAGGRFFELNENNEIVWEYIIPVNSTDGSFSDQFDNPPSQNLTFRATKYGRDYEAFNNRNINPSNTIEQNPNISGCLSLLNNNNFEVSELKIYPNATKDFIYLETIDNILELRIYNINGVLVNEFKRGTKKIDLTNLANGVYFLRVNIGNRLLNKKIIKI